jgi:glycosyltransferase involved in cell wall biosynthesis
MPPPVRQLRIKMRIAFYAPLKAPGHPVPSGDRLMARLLIAALTKAGHSVSTASELRAYRRDPEDAAALSTLRTEAGAERARLRADWQRFGPPDLWLCYHPYYKAPDLLGPALCAEFARPYVTVEASYSARRNIGIWAAMQAEVLTAVQSAAVNICLTARDHAGLRDAAASARLAMLPPFIDPATFSILPAQPAPLHLICAAMMREGDKLMSYSRLAAALKLLEDLPWVLSIIGDGPAQAQVAALFAEFPAARLRWHGQQDSATIARLFSQAALYVWPGCGEAFGLAYLEAQAAGLPVVAWQTAGVPEVVAAGRSGILTPEGDDAAYADAIAALLRDAPRRAALARSARAYVAEHHTLAAAATRLEVILRQHLAPPKGETP